MEGTQIIHLGQIATLKQVSNSERSKWKEERSSYKDEIRELKSKNKKLSAEVDEIFGISTSQVDLQTDKLENYAKAILEDTQKTLTKCKIDMKIAFKFEDKVENLRNQLDEKDKLIIELRQRITEIETDYTRKQNLLRNELSKEKMRGQETIFNISLKNGEVIQELQEQMAKKKNKIVYYEKKVDILKKGSADQANERVHEKGLIKQLLTKVKQQELENENLTLCIKAFQDDIQMRNMSEII